MAKKPKPAHVVTAPWPGSAAFTQAWATWKAYKAAEHNFTYKTPYSEQAALNRLYTLSRGNVDWALEIINTAMANAWQGLHQVKLQPNGERTSTRNPGQPGRTGGNAAANQYQAIEQLGAELLKDLTQLGASGSDGTSSA